MTSIGELFISLGVKGSDKTVGALTGMKQGLKDTASVSLEAKAAIVGAMYALERLFATSGKTGTDLVNFNAQTGVAMKTLQQYQYAARQVGVSNESVASTFKSLQTAMTGILTGKGAPETMARFARVVGGIDPKDIEKFMNNPELLMQKLQEYARKEKNVALRREVMSGLGVGDDMQASLIRQAYTPEILAKAPVYSDKEANSLAKSYADFANLGNKFEMAIGHFNAAHGAKLAAEISPLVDKVLALANAFERMAEKAELFAMLGKVFSGWALIFDGITKAIDYINDTDIEDKDKRPLAEKAADESYVPDYLKDASPNAIQAWRENTARQEEVRSSVFDFVAEQYREHFLNDDSPKVTKGKASGSKKSEQSSTNKKSGPAGSKSTAVKKTYGGGGGSAAGSMAVLGGFTPDFIREVALLAQKPSPSAPALRSVATPKVPPIVSTGNQTEINVKMENNFLHDGKDVQRSTSDLKKAVAESYRQLPQGRGN